MGQFFDDRQDEGLKRASRVRGTSVADGSFVHVPDSACSGSSAKKMDHGNLRSDRLLVPK